MNTPGRVETYCLSILGRIFIPVSNSTKAIKSDQKLRYRVENKVVPL